jgi:hypothetical protein
VDITENTITGDFLAQTQGAVLFPGLTAIGPTGPITPTEMNSNPVFTRRNAAILAVQVLGPHPQLFNAIIGDSLYQFTTTQSPIPNEDFTGDTLVEGNIITYKKNNSTEDGIVVSNTLRTTIRNNTIGRSPLDPDGPDGGRQASMRSGGITGPPGTGFLRQFPGNCTLNSTRHCLSDFDCNIPGIDPVSQDTCDLPQTQSVFWIPSNIMIENNTIYGPFGVAGISSLADDLTIQGNNITGPLTGPNALGGINIFGKFTIEKAVITRNRVSGVSTALFLNKVFGDTASFFGAKISLNDFTGYTTAVGTSNDYDLPSELSVDGKGNYWGLTCAEGGFDPTKVLRVNGTQNPNVVDSHPYGEPVANTPEEDLPLTCF